MGIYYTAQLCYGIEVKLFDPSLIFDFEDDLCEIVSFGYENTGEVQCVLAWSEETYQFNQNSGDEAFQRISANPMPPLIEAKLLKRAEKTEGMSSTYESPQWFFGMYFS